MRKIFIDCGTNMGMGFDSLCNKVGVDSTWEIYGFEPNESSFNGFVENIKSGRYPSLEDKNITLFQKAVWDEDGTFEFCMEGLSEQHYNENPEWKKAVDDHNLEYRKGKKLDYTEFGVYSLGGSCMKEMHEQLKRPSDHEIKFEWKDSVLVESIDFSNWIKQNFSIDDYIFLKMDIEGSEYRVLPKMISDDTMQYVNSLVIEWHDWVMPEYVEKTNELQKQIASLGVDIMQWG